MAYFSLHKLQGEWYQALSEMISGIAGVASRQFTSGKISNYNQGSTYHCPEQQIRVGILQQSKLPQALSCSDNPCTRPQTCEQFCDSEKKHRKSSIS